MELTAKVDKEGHVKNWIRIWNGGLQLTDKEQEFLAEFLLVAMRLKEDDIKEPYLSQLIFSNKEVAKVKEKLGLSKQGVSNYKTSLVDKGVFVKDDFGDYRLLPILIPEESITFKFEY